jgi:hypothetical protein
MSFLGWGETDSLGIAVFNGPIVPDAHDGCVRSFGILMLGKGKAKQRDNMSLLFHFQHVSTQIGHRQVIS